VFAAVGYAAAQARARARRSRLLDDGAWRNLVDAPSRERALDALLGALPASAHLEAAAVVEAGPAGDAPLARALRRRVHRETLALADSVPPRAGEALRWYARRFEVQDLKMLIRALHHDRAYAEALAATTLDLGAAPGLAGLQRVRSPAALVGALAGTPFGRALDLAWARYRSEGRPFYLEVALDLAFGRGLVERIEALPGADRADATLLLGRWVARTNLLAAVRYRALAGVSPEEVVNFTLHRDLGGGLAMVQRVASGAPVAAEAAALGVVLPPGLGEVEGLRALERATDTLQREAARRRFGRSPFGLGLVLAYLIELDAEARDLVALLEAKAQRLDEAALRRRIHRGVT